MKTPHFWYRRDQSPLILAPLSNLYAALGRQHRRASRPGKLPVPVICIGNLVSGGAGKTPTATAIRKLVAEQQISLSPFFLTRGYRGKIEGPERVDQSRDPRLWGDEALLLSRYAPAIVSKNRYAGGLLAHDLGADLVIMDDGMQNYSLKKDITFCVVDSRMGFGNEHVIPRGPLRQSIADGLNMTDAFILIGDKNSEIEARLGSRKPIFNARIEPRADQTFSTDISYIAFCGIGFPDKFQKSLTDAGIKLIGFRPYGDHHNYKAAEIQSLIHAARIPGARLITTEKDYARLPDSYRNEIIDVFKIDVVFDDAEGLGKFIRSNLR